MKRETIDAGSKKSDVVSGVRRLLVQIFFLNKLSTVRRLSPFTFHVSRFTISCLLIISSISFNACSSSSPKNDDDEKTKEEIPTRETFSLQKGKLTSTLQTPGELTAFQQVDIYAKVNSFVKKLFVDVGSVVKEGQMLAVLEAPEITSQLSAAESKLRSQEAVFISSKATYNRLLETSKTPGTIAQNDLDMAVAKKNSDSALLESAKADYKEILETKNYLEIRAPFSGVISARNINPGAYVGPSGKGSDLPMFVLQEQKKLRLVISVPEAYTDFINKKGEVQFEVNALPNQIFTAKVARLAGAVGDKLRSERVEMDVMNNNNKLLPGMAAEVTVPLPATDSSFVVPKTAVVNSTIKPFVIRVINNKAQWVNVQIGRNADDKEEIYGKLTAGDQLIKIPTEEIRDGADVKTK
ncbi:MAG TPA: efflux RND transporter periplasmic adaptor subunit [Puia sp.]|nr:efflux RND transporter periplasmic adaptor subunit [Puia sp.]